MSAHPFALGQVPLASSRRLDSQDGTRNHLRFIEVDRLLCNFRAEHRQPSDDGTANGGRDAPTFPFRTHAQGHALTARAQRN